MCGSLHSSGEIVSFAGPSGAHAEGVPSTFEEGSDSGEMGLGGNAGGVARRTAPPRNFKIVLKMLNLSFDFTKDASLDPVTRDPSQIFEPAAVPIGERPKTDTPLAGNAAARFARRNAETGALAFLSAQRPFPAPLVGIEDGKRLMFIWPRVVAHVTQAPVLKCLRRRDALVSHDGGRKLESG